MHWMCILLAYEMCTWATLWMQFFICLISTTQSKQTPAVKLVSQSTYLWGVECLHEETDRWPNCWILTLHSCVSFFNPTTSCFHPQHPPWCFTSEPGFANWVALEGNPSLELTTVTANLMPWSYARLSCRLQHSVTAQQSSVAKWLPSKNRGLSRQPFWERSCKRQQSSQDVPCVQTPEQVAVEWAKQGRVVRGEE